MMYIMIEFVNTGVQHTYGNSIFNILASVYIDFLTAN